MQDPTTGHQDAPDVPADDQGQASAGQLAGDTEPRRWSLFRRRPRATVEKPPAAPDHPEHTDPKPSAPAPEKEPKQRLEERRQTARAERPTPPPPVTDRSRWAICGVVVVGLLVLAIVGVGLYASLGALRDTALAAHMEPDAARLWWIGIDGLIVVAIVAAMILRHDPVARWYALGIVALFTAASGFLQFLHGRGLTTPTGRSGDLGGLPWPVVAVIALLVIGTIFCGTHLFVYVLRHLFPRALADQRERPSANAVAPASNATEPGSTDSDSGDGSPVNGRSESPQLDPETEREVRKWFAACAIHLILDAGGKPTRTKIARSFEIPDRQAGYVISDVVADREEAAARAAGPETDGTSGNRILTRTGSANGSGGAL